MIRLNNEKREKLTEENRKYYEKILIYIRVSLAKRELETEEILSELLDHLLDAQYKGKSAKEVFGDNPKEYADEIVRELPKINLKDTMSLLSSGLLVFIASALLFSGIGDLFIYFVVDLNVLTKEIFIGSLLLESILSIILATTLLYLIINFIKWSIFKNLKSITEFFILWISGMISVGLFMLIFWSIPNFGPTIKIHSYVMILFGVIIFIGLLINRIINKRKKDKIIE
nr:DUF1129 family protein [Anaeromonas frigoriresistens]